MIDRYHKQGGFPAGQWSVAGFTLLAAVSVANGEPLEVQVNFSGLGDFPAADQLAPALESAMAVEAGEPVQVQLCPLELGQSCEAGGSRRHLQIEVRPQIQAESGRGITVGVSANPRSLDYGKVTRLPITCLVLDSNVSGPKLEAEPQVTRSRLQDAAYVATLLADTCGGLLKVSKPETLPVAAQGDDTKTNNSAVKPAAIQVELGGSEATVSTEFGGDQR